MPKTPPPFSVTMTLSVKFVDAPLIADMTFGLLCLLEEDLLRAAEMVFLIRSRHQDVIQIAYDSIYVHHLLEHGWSRCDTVTTVNTSFACCHIPHGNIRHSVSDLRVTEAPLSNSMLCDTLLVSNDTWSRFLLWHDRHQFANSHNLHS